MKNGRFIMVLCVLVAGIMSCAPQPQTVYATPEYFLLRETEQPTARPTCTPRPTITRRPTRTPSPWPTRRPTRTPYIPATYTPWPTIDPRAQLAKDVIPYLGCIILWRDVVYMQIDGLDAMGICEAYVNTVDNWTWCIHGGVPDVEVWCKVEEFNRTYTVLMQIDLREQYAYLGDALCDRLAGW